MGLVVLPKLDHYWSKEDLYGAALVKKAMIRDRFSLLLRFWHFAGNTQAEPNNRLHKIQDVTRQITGNFQVVRTPGSHLVVDETMVPWRGRLAFRQYIPGNAHKYGFKLYKLCGDDGYTYMLSVYSGKVDAAPELQHAEAVVRQLVEGLLDAGRTLYADNFYTSLPLARYLTSRDTHLVGTLRANRKELPREVTCAKNLKKGDVIGRQDEKGIKTQWAEIA